MVILNFITSFFRVTNMWLVVWLQRKEKRERIQSTIKVTMRQAVKGTALQCMLHSFLLYHSGAKSLVHSHFGFSFSAVAGNTRYTKMQSKVWGKIYAAFFFSSLLEFSHCGNKEIGKLFSPSINKLENFSKLQKPQNRENRKKSILIPDRCGLTTFHTILHKDVICTVEKTLQGLLITNANCILHPYSIWKHNYKFCRSMTKANVWTWVHIHHKVMYIHFANLKNPSVLGGLGVWCKVWFRVDLQTINSFMCFLVFGDEYKF